MSLEDVTNDQENPKGYKPMELDYRDGHLWLPNGVRLKPDFEVGSERWQIDLFIEYERTFGRGKAFEITHQITEESQNPEMLSKYGGNSILNEFEYFASLVPNIVAVKENKEAAPKFIHRLREFRKRYPLLYEDADEHPNPGHIY